ncbi:MoaD/ThiS family protein [Natrinema halophilum]|uniref:MoaD/ThiS family protein n=1 Tax=Natrinema halophilum TaxID=1699371 RepID=A0A7D5KX16_9EURY|nr:MoaD/ThiS family protein [Natrinema halophilum]QLG48362.1 MoaD/ThiS family protein [Natrinema halophilum]
MQLECVFFGPFRDDVGRKTVRYETDAETVGDLLVELEMTYPTLEGRLLADDGSGLAGETVVTKDTKHVTQLDGLETPLAEGNVIRLVPSVYGGSTRTKHRADGNYAANRRQLSSEPTATTQRTDGS